MKTLRILLIGASAAFFTILIALLLETSKALEFLGVLLGCITGVYFGYVMLDGRFREMVTEIAFGILMLILILAGLWISPYYLVLGYITHGFWDLVHRPRMVRTEIPHWYVPLCSSFDWIVGAFILIWIMS